MGADRIAVERLKCRMSKAYIHGFSTTEQQRLTLMQSLLNQRQVELMQLGGIRRVLDVGSGLGQLTRAMARHLHHRDVVIGIEYNQSQIDEARRQAAADSESDLVVFRQGDATHLPLADGERGSFDLVHARFLLEHVTNPVDVVTEMVSAARPGGQIFLLDDDHELLCIWPACPELEHAWRVYWQSYRELGHDPLVGRRLAELMLQGGAQPTRVGSLFYGAVFGQPLFEPVVDNLLGVISSAIDRLDQAGALTHSQWQCALESAARWRTNEYSTVWYSLPFVQGIKPNHDRAQR